MIPARLVSCVKKEIEIAVKDYRMKAEGQADKAVTVYAQHIDDDAFENDSYYPLVIASLAKVEDAASDAGGSIATIGITFGVYGEDKLAWMDLLSIMERVRQRLLIFRKLDNRFRLILPTKFETIENQPYPFWFGYGTVAYQIGQPDERMADGWDKIMEEDNQ